MYHMLDMLFAYGQLTKSNILLDDNDDDDDDFN